MVTFNALSNLKNRAKSNFQRILRDLGEPVFIGDVPCQAIISDLTKSTNQLEDVREIETDYKFKRGDLVDWNNKKWFILSDIVEEHKHKYEGIMRPSNFSLSINVEGSNGTCLDWRRDGLGRPIECLR
ncbi:hypothetical protein ABZ630_02000, partial [Streptomyces albidoflavus]|uniref:hypothetical protein n=1 Tax=Streptomyces albidoflavus TaxID=1886 RepID=UPI0033C94463